MQRTIQERMKDERCLACSRHCERANVEFSDTFTSIQTSSGVYGPCPEAGSGLVPRWGSTWGRLQSTGCRGPREVMYMRKRVGKRFAGY